MNRVVVVGRGGSGKSTFSQRLSAATGLPVIELDKLYWEDSLQPLTSDQWRSRQSRVADEETWIMDGDLGPFDVLEPRLRRADTVVVMDTPLVMCLWRALRRDRRRIDFWLWVFRWNRTYRPQILADVELYAPGSAIVMLSSEKSISRFLVAHSNLKRT